MHIGAWIETGECSRRTESSWAFAHDRGKQIGIVLRAPAVEPNVVLSGCSAGRQAGQECSRQGAS